MVWSLVVWAVVVWPVVVRPFVVRIDLVKPHLEHRRLELVDAQRQRPSIPPPPTAATIMRTLTRAVRPSISCEHIPAAAPVLMGLAEQDA
jgi:hypothetical protein